MGEGLLTVFKSVVSIIFNTTYKKENFTTRKMKRNAYFCGDLLGNASRGWGGGGRVAFLGIA
jgi:hypothetical protein